MNVDRRRHFLEGARKFAWSASRLEGVLWLALSGSLTTDKPHPKDADVMVGIDPRVDLAALAKIGRSFKGHNQKLNGGADIFLFEGDRYIGRTCRQRDPWTRVVCRPDHCASGRPYLCDTTENVRLLDGLENHRHILLWPTWKETFTPPPDVIELLGADFHRPGM